MPAGNVFKPRRSLTRQTNPIQRNAMAYSTDDTRGQGKMPIPLFSTPGQGNPMQLAGGPYSFNPQNQDVLGRAAAALDAIQRDRMNPMGTVSNPEAGAVPQSMMSQSNAGAALYPSSIGRPTPAPGMLSQITGGAQGLMQRGIDAFNRAYPGQARRDLTQAQSVIGASHNIDGMVSRSRRDNPMAPPRDASMDAMNASDEVFNRFQRFQQAAPIPRDSFGAARNARQAYDQTTSGFSNGYNGMLNNPMMSANEKLQFAEQNARRVVGGGAAADPTNMRGRFGGEYGMGLNADANDIRSGKAVRLADGSVVRFTGTPESARQAQLAGKTEREVLRDRNNMNVPQEELDHRAAADAQQSARSARAREFEAANNGMNYRQMDRLQRRNALTEKAVREGRLTPEAANLRMQNRADTALSRAGNPMLAGTDESRSLFPDMTKGRGGQQTAPNPMRISGNPMAQNTPAGKMEAATKLKDMAATDPNIAALGFDPGEGVGGLHSALSQQFNDDPNLTLDDASLRSYQMFANQALTADPNQVDPSNFSSFPGSVFAETEGAVTAELWKELAMLPDDAKARQQWLQKYKNRQQEIERRQTEYYGSYGS